MDNAALQNLETEWRYFAEQRQELEPLIKRLQRELQELTDPELFRDLHPKRKMAPVIKPYKERCHVVIEFVLEERRKDGRVQGVSTWEFIQDPGVYTALLARQVTDLLLLQIIDESDLASSTFIQALAYFNFSPLSEVEQQAKGRLTDFEKIIADANFVDRVREAKKYLKRQIHESKARLQKSKAEELEWATQSPTHLEFYCDRAAAHQQAEARQRFRIKQLQNGQIGLAPAERANTPTLRSDKRKKREAAPQPGSSVNLNDWIISIEVGEKKANLTVQKNKNAFLDNLRPRLRLTHVPPGNMMSALYQLCNLKKQERANLKRTDIAGYDDWQDCPTNVAGLRLLFLVQEAILKHQKGELIVAFLPS